MTRFLFYLALAGVIYFALAGFFRRPRRREVRGPAGGAVEDVMVRDPECGVYLPRSIGVRKRVRGEEWFFCSEECARAHAKKRA